MIVQRYWCFDFLTLPLPRNIMEGLTGFIFIIPLEIPTVVFATENLTSSAIDQGDNQIFVFQDSHAGEAESVAEKPRTA